MQSFLLAAGDQHEFFPSNLHQQTLVVIGAGSGIGAAVARQAAARGARVVLAGRRLEALQQQQAQLPDSARSLAVDITDADSLQALFRAVGPFDHLVISAGPAIDAKPLAQTGLLEAQQAFEVKFWGHGARSRRRCRTWPPKAASP